MHLLGLLLLSIGIGTSLPATCTADDAYYITTAPGRLYVCTVGNNWTAIGGSAVWGGVVGTLSNQTDLQTALDGKEAAGTFSGVGTCTNQLVRGLNDGAGPTCASVATADVTDANITYAKIQDVSATQRVLGRNTAGAGDAEEVTATQLLDWLGSTRGSVLYRGASGWAILTPGTSTHVLTSNGAGADPSYQAVPGGAGDTFVTKSGDQGTTSTTPIDITGLSWAVSASTNYRFQCHVFFTAGATANGWWVGATAPASPTAWQGQTVGATSTTAVGGSQWSANDGGTVTGTSGATGGNGIMVTGILRNGSNAGTLALRWKNELNTSTHTILQGSYCRYTTF